MSTYIFIKETNIENFMLKKIILYLVFVLETFWRMKIIFT